jgi:DNA polymerase III delta prime subunit
MGAAVENGSEIEIGEAEIDAILDEAGGDPRRAIRNLLHDLARLALDAETSVSLGFVRGRLPSCRMSGGR